MALLVRVQSGRILLRLRRVCKHSFGISAVRAGVSARRGVDKEKAQANADDRAIQS
jgi:hypothetical protein